MCLHKNATTLPLPVGPEIQGTTKSVREIAREFGIREDTVRRWHARDSITDRSHIRHRLLKRHGLSRLATGDSADKRPVGTFKAYEPGFIDIDVKYLPQMDDESHRRYVFVAIDRALRFVYIAFKAGKPASAVRSFLCELH